ncbi:MAG TPA: hypothetical protein VLA98_10475 [Solirubrobacteraceae bacterium]|nr:hypothetical protein [Solirubrobacteraceae bacterium]
MALTGNPFDYQRPVAAAVLIDRTAELDALQRAAADAVAIRLAAPRRYGKTSLLAAHEQAMRTAGHRVARVDFSQVATVADAAARVARAFDALPSDPRRTFDRLLSRLGISFGAAGLTLTVSGRPATAEPETARAVLAELLDLPRQLHEADGGLTVVCFDEFQDLLTADVALDGLVRSVIQHHGRAAAYVYAGSAPSLMRALFADRERPLFGQARPLDLPPLPRAEAVADVLAIAADAGVELHPAAVRRIADLAGGHPQRTMLLAHHLFELAADGGGGDPAAAALDRALEETADVHRTVWDALGRPERAVVTALADGLPPTGSRTADQHQIPRATLQNALARLQEAEQHVVVRDGRPALVDPLLAIWLARR